MQKYNEHRLTDVARLQQILGNLIRNAILHSDGQNLLVGFAESKNRGQISGVWTIEDNGKGIPKELLPGLFEPFNRVSHGVFSRAEGMGMGMYIVKAFAETLGGTIKYERSNLGGAKFTVSVPLGIGDLCEVAPSPSVSHHTDKTVVLVEDNELVAEITQRHLKKIFKNVHHLSSAEALLNHYGELTPDVVITDIHLPRMNGKELTRRLRDRGFDGAIFGFSAAAMTARDLIDMGANQVLSKPLEMRELLKSLDQFEASVDA